MQIVLLLLVRTSMEVAATLWWAAELFSNGRAQCAFKAAAEVVYTNFIPEKPFY